MEFEYILPLDKYENIHLKGEVNDEDIEQKIVELVGTKNSIRAKLGLEVLKDETQEYKTYGALTNAPPQPSKTQRENLPGKGHSLNRALTPVEYAKFMSRVETEPNNDFLQDVSKKLKQYGSLSPKQIEAVLYPKPRKTTASRYAEEQ